MKATACGTFKPITWSHKDTPETVEQVVGHNAAGHRLCGWKGHSVILKQLQR